MKYHWSRSWAVYMFQSAKQDPVTANQLTGEKWAGEGERLAGYGWKPHQNVWGSNKHITWCTVVTGLPCTGLCYDDSV